VRRAGRAVRLSMPSGADSFTQYDHLWLGEMERAASGAVGHPMLDDDVWPQRGGRTQSRALSVV